MKQNRLVSRLPFFVFNCQGSRHHPAGHADKVLLAENYRHRVYGVGLRSGGHLRQVLRPNTGKALRNAQRPVHAVNGVNKYPGLLRPAPCRAQTQHIRQLRQRLVGRRAVLLQQLRQPLQAPGSDDAFRPAPGQYPGLQAEADLKHPTVYFFSSIMRTSFPWTITSHFRRDRKTEWGDGYCRGGRLCPSSAITQHFVGQGPCALPGVGLPGSGVRAPRPTHHLPIEFHKGRRPPTVVPTDSRPLSCPLIGALSRNYPASLHILLCVVGCDMSIAPHDRRRGYSCYAKATQAGRALRWIESKTMQKHGAFGLKSKSPAEPEV